MAYKKVRDLMRPISDFPSIEGKVTFIEAIDALERVQEDFQTGKAPEIILLIRDDDGTIIGRLSPMDIVHGLEPNYFSLDDDTDIPYRHLVMSTVERMRKLERLWQKPLAELCENARNITVDSFVTLPEANQMVDIDARIDIAFDLFVVLRHGSLFVTDDGRNIVGLLRFSDVYAWIKDIVRADHR